MKKHKKVTGIYLSAFMEDLVARNAIAENALTDIIGQSGICTSRGFLSISEEIFTKSFCDNDRRAAMRELRVPEQR